MDTIAGSASSGDGSAAPITAAATQISMPSVTNDESIPNPSGTQDGSIDEDDSASDISMAAETIEDPGTPRLDEHNSQLASPVVDGTMEIHTDMQAIPSNKRKSPDQDWHDQGLPLIPALESSKRVKLDSDHQAQIDSKALGSDKSLLPPEIWHHVFTFCPPKTLGNLLCVNKLFHVYLDPSSSIHQSASPRVSPGKSAVGILKPNGIWQASRQLFWPHMPAPLRSMTELESWRLACSTRCQACNKQDARDPQPPSDAWHPGPGMEGVSVIWPFAIRVCGPCLLRKSIKEIDILLSSSIPSAIIPALPFVFCTQELHALSASILEHAQLPSTLQLTKFFLPSDVDEIKEEFISVKEMGPGTAEEWFKGLDGRGKDHRSEAAKWEKWESSGGRASILAAVDPVPSQPTSPSANLTPSTSKMQSDLPQPQEKIPGNSPGHYSEDEDPLTTSSQPRTLPQARQERTIEEVAGLKSARKSEIERRAALLAPPLQLNVLCHMPSFQAATQLITPLDDNAWELLKPRLLAQRADAEQRNAESAAQARTIETKDNQRGLETTLATTKEARDLVDKDWEEVQAPVRAYIASFADEIIRDGWDNGKQVTKETCSRFAVDVLTHVRRRFYDQVAADAVAARVAGRDYPADPPDGPFTQKLTLENMKWVFDTKIKPHTESHKKELFYCNGCEGNFKIYGFEGVIQHYAAKHTSALSLGSIVVHWRAEWPEVPPFTAQARLAKNTYYSQGAAPFPQGVGPAHPTYSFNGYQPPPGPTPSLPGQSFPPPGPVYGAPPYTEQYPQPPYQQGVGYPQPSGLPPQPFPPPPVPAPYPAYQPPSVPNGAYPPHPAPGHTQGYPPPSGAPQPPSQVLAHPPAGQYNYNYGAYQGNGQISYPPQPGQGYADIYRVQLEDVVRNSREIWNATANIKDLPGSVRVFTTIHHLVKRFRSRFSETPSLEIFNEGLSNNKDMRPVRNINALSCRACHFGLGNAPSVEQERKTFSLPQLVNHFQNKHVDPMQRMAPNSPPLDWTVDMVLLPDPPVLAKLPAIIGSDSQKYHLFSDAFPEFFHQASNMTATAQHYTPQPSYDPHHEYSTTYQPPPNDSQNYFDAHPPGNNQTAHSAEHDSYYGAQAPPGPYSQPNYDQGPPQNPYSHAPPQAFGHEAESLPPNPVPSRSVDNKSRSSRGSGPGRGQNQKKSGKSKNGRPKNSGAGGAAAKLINEEEAKKAEEEEKLREEEIKAMWAAGRAEAARTYSASVKPEPEAEPDQGRRQSQPKPNRDQPPAAPIPTEERNPPRREIPEPRTASPPPPREEPNLMAALEMHLEQGNFPTPPEQRRQPPSRVIYVDDSHSSLGPESHREVDRYPVYAPDRVPSRPSRPPPTRYEQPPASAEVYRVRSPTPRQAEASYYSRPPPSGGAEEFRYAQAPRGPDQYDPTARGPDVHPYDTAYRRTEELPYEAQGPPRQEYYRTYPDEPPPRARVPVEAYEIVRVIDDQGEYYIRRPVRQEPEPRYAYETERPIRREPGPEPRYIYEGERPPVHREPEPYPPGGYEPVYSRAPPPPAPHPTAGYELRPEYPPRMAARPEPAAAAYDEEYDPRFPAAPPGGVPPRQVRYQ